MHKCRSYAVRAANNSFFVKRDRSHDNEERMYIAMEYMTRSDLFDNAPLSASFRSILDRILFWGLVGATRRWK